jgi:type II secretory pathway pseudopilin PulG
MCSRNKWKGKTVERKKPALTMVELLMVLAIIALIVGILIPAVGVVKSAAKQTKQKAQFTTIELGLTAFKNDYGDYPPSNWVLPPAAGSDYCGAQKLAEALVGWDLLGFHPDSAWRADGLDAAGGPLTYEPPNPGPLSLDKRKGPYLELATATTYRLGNLFARTGTGPLAPNTFVLCDAFGATKVTLANGKTVTAGSPILYYRANTSAKTIRGIYNVSDNDALVAVKEQADGKTHPLGSGPYPAPFRNQAEFFYGDLNAVGAAYIEDPKVTARPWPYRPDSYLLVSAGPDGIYGTSDDVRNFGD